MARVLLQSSLLLIAPFSSEAGGHTMTRWSMQKDIIVGSPSHVDGELHDEGGPSACFFADPSTGGLNSPSAQTPYIKKGHYCAADIHTLFNNGKACGQCLRVSYNGHGGTNGGHAGSLVIQIVNSGHMNHNAALDCHVDAFAAITGGARTGVYPITYEEVACDQSEGRGVATVLRGDNAYYSKLVFSNFPRPPTRVQLLSHGKRYNLQMEPCCGTWAGQLGGETGVVSFELGFADGSTTNFADCFESWPVKTADACHQGGPANSGPTDDREDWESEHKNPVHGGAKCSDSWGDDCRATKCCKERNFKCFRKNQHWAGCRPSCTAGMIDDYDNHPWQCAHLTQLDDETALSKIPKYEGVSGALQASIGALSALALAASLGVAWKRRRTVSSAPEQSSLIVEDE